MKIQQRDPKTLKPYDGNPNTHPPEQVQAMVEALDRYGWRQPIVVDDESVIVMGHLRRAAGLARGDKKVPVHVVTDLPPETVASLRIFDLRIQKDSKVDNSVLRRELELLDQAGVDLAGTGYTNSELERIMAKELTGKDPDVLPEFPATTTVKSADVYTLGRHRIVVGDPEHGDLWNRARKGLDPAARAGLVAWEFSQADGNRAISACLKATAAIAVYAAAPSGYAHRIAADVELFGMRMQRSLAVDVKRGPMPGVWQCSHVVVTFAQDVEITRKKGSKAKRGVLRHTGKRAEVLMPVAAWVEILTADLDHKRPDTDVLNPGLGSGEVLMAAEISGRRCLAVENDPLRVDLVLRRWQAYTGKKPRKAKRSSK